MTTIAIFSVFGGIMLLLYGMKLVGKGLQKAAGTKLRAFLFTATSNRLRAVGVGAVTTALLQSSSATTIMLVGFVGTGLIGLGQTMGVILGADIGTTLTVQIIAFDIYEYAIALIGIGAFIRFISKGGTVREVGLAILGFGFVFLSLKILVETFEPASKDPLLQEFLLSLSQDPIAAIIIATLVTAILHTSAATLGLAITAAHTGLLPLEAAVPIVLGANIGTCVSAIISSIGAPVDAKRVALAHVLFKVFGVLIVLPFLIPFTDLVSMTSSDPARQVAYAHTFFNVGLCLVFLPFTGAFTRLVIWLMPAREEARKFGAKYLDQRVLTTPSLALGQATREALRLADIIQEMLTDALSVFKRDDMTLLEDLEDRDNNVDILDREIKFYLTKLTREELSAEQARREYEILAFTNNLENIGDVIDKNLMELARKKITKNRSFSVQGIREIEGLHRKILENFSEAVATFAGSDCDLARRLISHKTKIAEMEQQMREAHIERLHSGLRESIDTSSIHLDVLANLKRINSISCSIAYVVLERDRKE